MKTITATHYTSSSGTWTTDDYSLAIALAAKEARADSRLFVEIYDKKTNMIVGYASFDGKEM